MPNYAALKSYIATQPSGTTDAEIIAAVNAATTAVAVSVPTQAIAAYLGENNLLAGFLGWAASPPTGASAASQVAAKSLAFAFENVTLLPAFDMANSTVAANMQADLAALVTPGSGVTGPISAADQAAILAMAGVLTSQALEWGFPNGIVEADLVAARNLA